MFTHGDQDLLSCLPRPLVMDRRWKPNVEISPNCPRCNSPNTKFCYYNNYSLTQPRYFCKGCRRYWTKGGSLRNVPIGGGCRKNRRGKSIRISSDRASIGNSSIHRIAPPGIGSSGFDSSDCSVMGSSSTIDLALVYAKFLNQHQTDSNPRGGFEMHELPREFHTPFDLSNISDPNVQFSLDQGIVGCNGTSNPSPDFQLSEGHQVLSEFDSDSNYKQQERISDSTSLEMSTNGLQPVMTDEFVVHEDMLWSNSPMVASNFRWEATQLQGFETFPDDHLTLHSNPLDDNWSSFDLPSFEAFSRP